MCPHPAKHLEDAVHVDALVLLALRLLNVELSFLRDIQRNVLRVSNLLNFCVFVVVVVSPTVHKSKILFFLGGGAAAGIARETCSAGGPTPTGGLLKFE